MLACETLRAAEPAEDPGDPCPNCLGLTVEDGCCWLCRGTFCVDCSKVEVIDGASCEHCAPVYEVATMARPYYTGRNLRRAWETECFLQEAGYRDAMLTVPDRVDVDFDGLGYRERELTDAWDLYEDGKFAPVVTCLPPSEAADG